MRYLMIFLLAALAPSAANAADWQLVSTASDGSLTYVDASSVVVNGNYRTDWEKSVKAKTRADGTAYTIDHYRYDCANRTYTMLSYAHYTADGNNIDSYQVPSYRQEANDVVPDSVGEALFKFVVVRVGIGEHGDVHQFGRQSLAAILLSYSMAFVA